MEDYVTFEQAKKLKELGFDWKCNHYYDIQTKKFWPVDWFDYDGDIDADDFYYSNWPKDIIASQVLAPTLAQAQKWLREVKGIYIEISRYHLNNFAYELKLDYDYNREYCCQGFMTPEKALLKGLDEALELLK